MTDKRKVHIANPLQRIHMPTDYSISLAQYTGRGTANEVRIPKDSGPTQSLKGFEETYRNIIDYIVRITYRIWEDREVEYIRACYSPNSIVFDDYGLQPGNEKIVCDTHHTTGAFSNIQLIADEVIWAGNDKEGFHTSHRTIIRGSNDGDSKYGPATGKHIDVLVIANCVALENDIFLEHVLYNTSSMLQQLGMDLQQQVTRLAQHPLPGWPRDAQTWTALRQATSPAVPISVASPVSGFDPDQFVRHNFDQLWNKRNYAVLVENYQADFPFAGPTDRKFSGHSAYREFLQSLLQTFPDLALRVDEVYWMGNNADGYLVSIRWSAEGTHSGSGLYSGLYGQPSGHNVQIWGISQQEIKNQKVIQEWTLFNELDLMMQIEAARSTYP